MYSPAATEEETVHSFKFMEYRSSGAHGGVHHDSCFARDNALPSANCNCPQSPAASSCRCISICDTVRNCRDVVRSAGGGGAAGNNDSCNMTTNGNDHRMATGTGHGGGAAAGAGAGTGAGTYMVSEYVGGLMDALLDNNYLPVACQTDLALEDPIERESAHRINVDHHHRAQCPACWQDEEHLTAMLAAADSEVSEMKFWQCLIAQYCEHKGSAFFSKWELRRIFTNNHQQVPSGMDTVLRELLRQKTIKPRTLASAADEQQFNKGLFVDEEDNDDEDYDNWMDWAVRSFVKKPFAWSLQKLRSFHPLQVWNFNIQMLSTEPEHFVHVELFQKLCRNISTFVLLPHGHTMMTYPKFVELVKDKMTITTDCLLSCVKELNRKRKIGLCIDGDEGDDCSIELVKIPSMDYPDIEISSLERTSHITQERMLQKLQEFEQELKRNEMRAREYLATNKSFLHEMTRREKELFRKSREELIDPLNSIKSILDGIRIEDYFKCANEVSQPLVSVHYMIKSLIDNLSADQTSSCLDYSNEVLYNSINHTNPNCHSDKNDGITGNAIDDLDDDILCEFADLTAADNNVPGYEMNLVGSAVLDIEAAVNNEVPKMSNTFK